MFSHIVPCGIADRSVTSLRAEGVAATPRDVVDALVEAARTSPRLRRRGGERGRSSARTPRPARCAPGAGSGSAAGPAARRLAAAGVDPAAGVEITDRKPPWLRVAASMGDEYLAPAPDDPVARPRHRLRGGGLPEHLRVLGRRDRDLDDQRRALHAGLRLLPRRHVSPPAPRCLRARQGRRRGREDGPRPRRRDDRRPGRSRRRRRRGGRPDDPPRSARPRPARPSRSSSPTARATRPPCGRSSRRVPTCSVTTWRPCCACSVRSGPQASYARSLGVLAAAKAAGLVTKSGFMLGLGETEDEVDGALADLASIGVDIVTIGQYLRPSVRFPAGRTLVDPGRVRRRAPSAPWPSASRTSRRRRSRARATTPARGPRRRDGSRPRRDPRRPRRGRRPDR